MFQQSILLASIVNKIVNKINYANPWDIKDTNRPLAGQSLPFTWYLAIVTKPT